MCFVFVCVLQDGTGGLNVRMSSPLSFFVLVEQLYKEAKLVTVQNAFSDREATGDQKDSSEDDAGQDL